jgi:hypothetical protein
MMLAASLPKTNLPDLKSQLRYSPSSTASGTTVPTTSRRCEPPWRKRRGERPFRAKPRAVRKEERAVVKEISREELKAKMERGDDFVLLEALSRRHYESSHLPGAINLHDSSATWEAGSAWERLMRTGGLRSSSVSVLSKRIFLTTGHGCSPEYGPRGLQHTHVRENGYAMANDPLVVEKSR